MQERTIARRYARAFIESMGHENIQKLDRDVLLAETIWKASPAVRAWFLNPTRRKEERLAGVERFLRLSQFSEKAESFFRLLALKNRLTLMPHILQLLRELSDSIQNRIQVGFVSARRPAAQVLEGIKTILEDKLGKRVLLDAKEDNRLLGGVVLKIKGTVIDASIRTKLERLKSTLKEGEGWN